MPTGVRFSNGRRHWAPITHVLPDGDTKRELLRAVGLDIAVQIQNRTLSGKDSQGRRFKPYTPAYAKQKRVSVTAVDLARTGAMLNDLTVTDIDADQRNGGRGSVKVGFSEARLAERAGYNQAQGRRFLGCSDNMFRETLRKWLARILPTARARA